ncbi:MAG: hypothetical protein ACP5VP_01145 [Candidatus Limnocylindrales bacterium]
MSGRRIRAAGPAARPPDGSGIGTLPTSATRAGVRGLWQRLRQALVSATTAAGPRVDGGRLWTPDAAQLEFAGYAEDCRVFGFLRLDTERLTDYLNARQTYEVEGAIAVGLEDGRAIEAPQLSVCRDELLAVRAAGPRGNAGRRARVRPYPVTLQAGPYTVHGYVHALPGADPIRSLQRRKPMVPFTEAWIEYATGDDVQRARVGTLIVNRERIDWIAPSDDEAICLPDLPLDGAGGLLVKDFTGYILATGP